ncbi:MAG: efflux RND transporter periplasmic adaptor subunit, partial [Phycisphaeraceae bacterium]
HVDREGQRVQRGDPLLEVYAPELFAAQQEYLIAYRNRENAGMDDGMLESARTRLRYFDMTDQQIAALEQRGTPQKTVTVYSPHTGVVTARHANEGMRIGPEMRLYRIADLSTVWVMVSIYESQLSDVSEGQRARMRLTSLPTHTYEGEIVEVYPYMDAANRQARARLRFDNPDGALKPGMYATIELERTVAEDATLVPSEAVIGTGERQVVLVSLGEGRFEPREVTTGAIGADDRVQILEGLEPGAQVVVSGQFLLDSESRTREALAKMVEGEMAAAQAAEVDAADAQIRQALPEAAQAQLVTLIEQYLAVGEALHADSTDGVATPASRMLEALNALTASDPPDAPHFWHEQQEHITTIRAEAQAMHDASDLKQVRIAYGKLSAALEVLLMRTGVPKSYERPLDRMVCGMFDDVPQRGLWLQPGDIEPRNPYMGASMPTCNQNSERRRLPVAESAEPSATQPRPQHAH